MYGLEIESLVTITTVCLKLKFQIIGGAVVFTGRLRLLVEEFYRLFRAHVIAITTCVVMQRTAPSVLPVISNGPLVIIFARVWLIAHVVAIMHDWVVNIVRFHPIDYRWDVQLQELLLDAVVRLDGELSKMLLVDLPCNVVFLCSILVH